ncbi:hypothetical protein [Pseudonocardia sp. T1-2H]|uniref:hypothetical protein n=1 Tax=Pseudonocardia sp. T1-2H TaxID=3128899 RepID=UPI0031017357
MEHHETPTAKRLKLTTHMIAAMFGANRKVAPATRKALVSRGLAVEAGSDVVLTDEGKRVCEAMEAEVFDAPHTVPAEDVKAGTTIVHEDVTVEITRDARIYSTATKPGGKAVALNGRATDGVLWEGTAVPGLLSTSTTRCPTRMRTSASSARPRLSWWW